MPEFFVLREAHLQAFRSAGLARFRRKAATILRRRFPDECERPDAMTLEQRIELWNRQAREAGLRTERQMIRYLASELLLSRVRLTSADVQCKQALLTRAKVEAEQRSLDAIEFASRLARVDVPKF